MPTSCYLTDILRKHLLDFPFNSCAKMVRLSSSIVESERNYSGYEGTQSSFVLSPGFSRQINQDGGSAIESWGSNMDNMSDIKRLNILRALLACESESKHFSSIRIRDH